MEERKKLIRIHISQNIERLEEYLNQEIRAILKEDLSKQLGEITSDDMVIAREVFFS